MLSFVAVVYVGGLLLVVCCMSLFVVRGLLLMLYVVWRFVRCLSLLSVVNGMLFVVGCRCVSFVVCCLLSVVGVGCW